MNNEWNFSVSNMYIKNGFFYHLIIADGGTQCSKYKKIM